jgi:peptide/nickel transport system substrate-binding protein
MMEGTYWEAWRRRRVGRRRALRTLAGAGALVAVGSACATPAAAPAAPPSPAAGAAPTAPPAAAQPTPAPTVVQPKRGGTFRWASSTPFSVLDPHQSSAVATFGYGIGVCWSRLLKFKLRDVQLPAFVPTGDAAASWDQPDETTYVFKLRPNVKWQNLPPVSGRELVAEDVAYSFNRQRTQGYPNASILDAVAKLEVVDKGTLKITANGPSADFLINIAAPQSVIVPYEVVDLKGDLRQGPLIGTGAFIVETTDPNGTSVARRNPDYFVAGQPYIDTYQFIAVPDAAAILSAFRAGNVEMIPQASVTLEQGEALKRTNPGTVIPMVKALGSGNGLGMRQDQPPFNDPRVRQAVYKAIDPETIVKTAYGSGWLTIGIPLPGVDWALPADEIGRLYKRDLAATQRLLKEAGLENGLDFTITVSAGPGNPEAAELIAAQLKEANIRATLKPVDNPTFVQQVQQRGDFQVFYGATQAAPSADAGLFGFYHSKGSRNVTKVNDPKLDQMIEQQTLLGRKPDERKKLLLDTQRLILEQSYYRHVQTYEAPAAVQPYVRDLFLGFGGLNLEMDRWAQVWLDK